jgi:hypothetical protein
MANVDCSTLADQNFTILEFPFDQEPVALVVVQTSPEIF